MTTYFDTSVVIPLTDPAHEHHQWCRDAYEKAARTAPPLVISDMVYCEVSMGFRSKADVDKALRQLAFERVGYSDEVLFRAGEAYNAYKKRGGKAKKVLPDFLIGALADLDNAPLVTRDTEKFQTYFPELKRIIPSKK